MPFGEQGLIGGRWCVLPWRRSMRIVGDCQQVTVKHHWGLDSARVAAGRAQDVFCVPDPDLGMTDRLPNQALELDVELS